MNEAVRARTELCQQVGLDPHLVSPLNALCEALSAYIDTHSTADALVQFHRTMILFSTTVKGPDLSEEDIRFLAAIELHYAEQVRAHDASAGNHALSVLGNWSKTLKT